MAKKTPPKEPTPVAKDSAELDEYIAASIAHRERVLADMERGIAPTKPT